MTMPEVKLYVDLLSHTLQPELMTALSARLCYSGADIASLKEKVEDNSQRAFLEKLKKQNHFSPIEHASFSFGVEGVSRALLAQITRHRLASFSVQSQRYVVQAGQEGFNYIIPPRVHAMGAEAVARYEDQMKRIADDYEYWLDLLGSEAKEDARFVLPNACETRFVMTMNARELIHFLSLRCCERAQWEIRALSWAILGHLLNVAPLLFEDAGPSCVAGSCSEGEMSCRRQTEIKYRAHALKSFVQEKGGRKDFAEQISNWATMQVAMRSTEEEPRGQWNFDIRQESIPVRRKDD